MASKLTGEQRAFYRCLACDGDAGPYAQKARDVLIADGQAFTIYPHKVRSVTPAKATPTIVNRTPTAAGKAAMARAQAPSKRK